jgi:cbb3-type cytochrome oxidase subunit 3
MPGAERAELYFIAAMMVLILIVCFVACYFFFKTYRKEMREREERLAQKRAEKVEAAE